MFSEGQEPTQVVIELDLQPEAVRMVYRQYLETKNMYDFLQVYDQMRHSNRYSISSFLRLHKIVSDLGMGEQQIINVLNLANYNQLEHLQWKVEYLANEVNMLEEEKRKCTNDIATLNYRRDQYMREEYRYESHLAQPREKIDYIENRSRLSGLDNRILGLPDNGGLYSTYSVHSMRALTYSGHGEYPKTDDGGIRPVSSNMRGDSSYRSIEEKIATKIFNASADWSHMQ